MEKKQRFNNGKRFACRFFSKVKLAKRFKKCLFHVCRTCRIIACSLYGKGKKMSRSISDVYNRYAYQPAFPRLLGIRVKKRRILLIGIFIISFMLIGCAKQNDREEAFFLDDQYYEAGDIKEITADELMQHLHDSASFVLFIDQPMSRVGVQFEAILQEFVKANQIGIDKIAWSDVKNQKIGIRIKDAPVLIIFHNGKMVDYLVAEDREDAA